MTGPEVAAKNQNGKFMVTWIGGVLVGALLIGAGLYFGLSMLQGDKASTNQAAAPAATSQPTAPTAPAVSTQARVAAPAPAPSPSQMSEETIEQAESDDLASPELELVDEKMATDPDNIAEEQPGGAQPMVPRAATTGGIAAARLPSGEEIMVPAGVRVDEYIAQKAKERGLVLEEEPRPGTVIDEDQAQDVTLETDLRTQQELDEDDTVYQPRTPN